MNAVAPPLQAEPLIMKQDAFSPQVQEFWSIQVPNISIAVIIISNHIRRLRHSKKNDRDHLQGTLSIALVSVFFCFFFPLNV